MDVVRRSSHGSPSDDPSGEPAGGGRDPLGPRTRSSRRARRRARQDAVDLRDPLRASLPRSVKRYLLPSERTVVHRQRHPAQLLEPVGSVVLGFVLVVWIGLELPPDAPVVGDVLFGSWAVLLGRAVWKLLVWRGDWFVATDKRLLLTYGVVNRKVAMMPFSKVTDMSYRQSLAGRLLDYGEFVLESAGQDQALRNIAWMPEPDDVYLRIVAEIFGTSGKGPREAEEAEEEAGVGPHRFSRAVVRGFGWLFGRRS